MVSFAFYCRTLTHVRNGQKFIGFFFVTKTRPKIVERTVLFEIIAFFERCGDTLLYVCSWIGDATSADASSADATSSDAVHHCESLRALRLVHSDTALY
jgi:hypothetical protein